MKKYKLSLKLEEHITSDSYKQPIEKKRRMFVFRAKRKSLEKTFIMNNHRLFCLEDNTSIHMDKSHYSSEYQIMFGQAEIIITKNKYLIISR